MKIERTLLIMLFMTILMAGCKKQEVTDPPGPTPAPGGGETSSIQLLFAENLATARQGITLDAATGGELTAAKGTRLNFAPGAFLHLDGTSVAGIVDVAVIEVLEIGDMIWLNKQTVGDDNGTLRLLRSGGAINVSATQGGNMLRVTQGGLFARIPTEVGDPEMQLFIGDQDDDGTLVWYPRDSTDVTVEDDYFNLTYAFPMDTLTWISINTWNLAPGASISATIPDDQPQNNTVVWTVLPSENSVVEMFYSNYPQTFEIAGYVPLGLQAVVVALHQNSSGFYSSFNPITITGHIQLPLTFTETTLEEFQADVNAL